ncbi:MAG: hypothetical protein IH862_05930 [Chloroflexi bacterium]|nr:hypothetical protein [Chloroflexota bacterium]
MKTMRGVVIRESDSPWEGWADPVIGAKSPIRWKVLVTGERTPSEGLTMGSQRFLPAIPSYSTTTNLKRFTMWWKAKARWR